MRKSPPTAAITVNPTLLKFKPRQLLLLSNNSNMNNNNNNNKTLSLKPDQRAILLLSIAHYLERNGFFKTLKKFQSEAHFQKGDSSASSLDLEEIYCKHLESHDHAGLDFNKLKIQDIKMDGNFKKDGKKKKRRSDNSDNSQSGTANKLIDSKNAGETVTDNAGFEANVKSREKKKSKKISGSLGQTEKMSPEVLKEPADNNVIDDKKKKKTNLTFDSKDKQGADTTKFEEVKCEDVDAIDVPLEDGIVKSKDKKKKKNDTEKLSGKESEKLDGTDTKKDDLSEEDLANKENKGIKKRKRLAYLENDAQPVDQKTVKKSKRRKTDCSEDPERSGQPTNMNASMETVGHAGKESNGESNTAGQETSIKKLNAVANGNLEKGGEKSVLQKTMNKQWNGSAESKTVKPFQRVKVEEVTFIDERLQDNSYWAKDGAESGYGAKAQEALGQVRGRDFRHEKTKKKRGSYRGGQIDLRSHSIKFSYSDEE
ncbi:SRP40_C domain-containing protein [Cephalotus follicularis]|uniref:SRP40_C domain-containing protein n=1 Tax=Cephalotus follicularis TaxID=3775 RepID=A0A1Q3AVJ5_CEPFO|nr:SRP40_C domain-containing protein [Cephalotus follicularis]